MTLTRLVMKRMLDKENDMEFNRLDRVLEEMNAAQTSN
jgi:hypothetical protein